jgi:hypothetical protein
MRLLFVPLITIILTGCEGHYRYPCQDPANWGKLECNNDVCKAEGTCTADVLAPPGSREFGTPQTNQSTEESIDESSNNSLQDGESEISNSGCAEPQQLSYKGKGEEERIFNVKNKMVLPEKGNDGLDRDVITAIENATEEQPVTLSSEVDAVEHDKATM